MNTKLALLAMLLTLLAALLALPALAESGSCGDNVTWTLDDSGKLTIQGEGPMWDYSSTQQPTYMEQSFSTVEIKSGVTIIGNYAFIGSSAMTEITIPESVTSIGKYAFYSCRKLTGIILPEGLDNTSERMFENCTA